jgi:arabinose-5-phosphate isomerase
MNKRSYIESARRTIELEVNAVKDMEARLDEHFDRACELIYESEGRLIVTGIGKSGHIANKIAATFASTGTPSFFVHASEAAHGDFGMITKNDVVIAISNSGSSAELVTLIPMFKRLGVKLISMTGNDTSPLAEAGDVHLNVGVESEACPLNLAPTSSTTCTLIMGDALAVALLEARGFSSEDFAFSHPGGALGKKLLTKVQDLMHSGDELPAVNMRQHLPEVLSVMTSKGFGLTVVTNEEKQLIGIFTDGDLRRCVNNGITLNDVEVSEVMTRSPRTIESNILAAEALRIMEENKITALVVEDTQGNAAGVIHMHDLLRAGIY